MFLMPDNNWARLLAYVTGLVHQILLLQNEYLAAENRILRALCVAKTPFIKTNQQLPHAVNVASGEAKRTG